MVLQRPLAPKNENLTSAALPGTTLPLVPAAEQPKTMCKPHRPYILCPLEGPGYE